jgi:hypothetical protein
MAAKKAADDAAAEEPAVEETPEADAPAES